MWNLGNMCNVNEWKCEIDANIVLLLVNILANSFLEHFLEFENFYPYWLIIWTEQKKACQWFCLNKLTQSKCDGSSSYREQPGYALNSLFDIFVLFMQLLLPLK